MPRRTASAGLPTCTGLPWTRMSPESLRSAPKMSLASSVRPAPTSPATPRISPRLRLNETSLTARPRDRPRTSRTTFGVWHLGNLRRLLVDDAAHHHGDDLVDGDRRRLDRGHVPAVAHDGHPIGDLPQLLKAMRDVDDAHALRAESADDAEELVDLRVGQGGRRLVHDEDGGVQREGLGDLDHLLLRDLEVADLGARVEPQVEPVDELGGQRDLLLLVHHEGEAAPRLAAHVDVLGDGEVRSQHELLVDHAEAQVAAGSRVRDVHLLALERDGAGILAVDAGQDLHERGLAGAVLADEGMHLAGAQLELGVHQGLDAGEVLVDALHADQKVSRHAFLASWWIRRRGCHSSGSPVCAYGIRAPTYS